MVVKVRNDDDDHVKNTFILMLGTGNLLPESDQHCQFIIRAELII